MRDITRRVVAACATAIVAAAALVGTTAVPATAADPVTSSEDFPDGTTSAAYSDTTAGPGDAFTVTVTFTSLTSSDSFVSYAFGAEDSNDNPLFVLDSCTTTSNLTGTCETVGSNLRFRELGSGLPAGQSGSVTFDVHVNDTAAPGTYGVFQSGDFGSSARKGFDPDVDFTVEQAAEADLSGTLAASAPLLLGGAINYTATATNTGPGTATGAQIRVNLPTQATSVSNLPSGCTYNAGTDVVDCAVGDIASADSAAVSFRANLGLLTIGPLNATTTVFSTTFDPVATNNVGMADCTVVTGLVILC